MKTIQVPLNVPPPFIEKDYKPYAYYSKLLSCWFVVSRYVHPTPIAPVRCKRLDNVVSVAVSIQKVFRANPIVDEYGRWIDEDNWEIDCWNPHKRTCIHGVKA